jgi:hypothetical protein
MTPKNAGRFPHFGYSGKFGCSSYPGAGIIPEEKKAAVMLSITAAEPINGNY